MLVTTGKLDDYSIHNIHIPHQLEIKAKRCRQSAPLKLHIGFELDLVKFAVKQPLSNSVYSSNSSVNIVNSVPTSIFPYVQNSH